MKRTRALSRMAVVQAFSFGRFTREITSGSVRTLLSGSLGWRAAIYFSGMSVRVMSLHTEYRFDLTTQQGLGIE